jgi:hypothetical protein
VPRWRDADFQADLRRLLRAARRGRDKLPLQVAGSHELRTDVDFQFRSIPGGSYVLDGEALALRRTLRRTLAGRSRRELRLSGDVAGLLLQQACDEAVTGTITAAVANLVAAVEEPVKDWVVAQSVDIRLPRDSLRVGHATYTTRIPRVVRARRDSGASA